MYKIFSAVVVAFLITGCGGSSGDNGVIDADSGVGVDENVEVDDDIANGTDTDVTDSGTVGEESVEVDDIQVDDTVTEDSVTDTSGEEENVSEEIEVIDSSGNDALLGTWVSCDGGLGVGWTFTDTSFRTFFAVPLDSECNGLLTIENSTQGGSYEIVGTATSEEGLPVLVVEFDIMDVFGGIDDQGTAPTVFNVIHVDGNAIFFGFSADTVDGVSSDLDLDRPLLLQP